MQLRYLCWDYGQKVKITVIKNWGANPSRSAVLELHYGQGFSVGADMLDRGLKDGTIKQSGAYYEVGDKKLHGRSDAIRHLRSV